MKKIVLAALAATTAVTGVMSAGAAGAQPGHYVRVDDRRDWDRNHRGDHQGDQGNHRRGDNWERPRNWDRWYSQDRWRNGVHYYGGKHGYKGYHGQWRTGQRYPFYRDNRYVIEDYRYYRLPAPRAGYRYYRDDNGDIVMAAITSGIIGLIIGSQLN